MSIMVTTGLLQIGDVGNTAVVFFDITHEFLEAQEIIIMCVKMKRQK